MARVLTPSRLAALVCVALVAPIWLVELQPGQDVASHLARIHVILDLLGDGARFGGFFELALLPLPNIGADLVLVPLAAVVGVELAGKLFLTGVLGLTAYAQARFLRAAGCPEAGWLALPLVWNFFVHMGMLSFLLSVPLALLAWALFLERRARWRPRDRVLFGLLATATYLAHLSSFCVLVAAVQLHKARDGGWRRLFAIEPGVLPGLACYVALWLGGEGGSGRLAWPDLDWKLGGLANQLFGLHWKWDLVVMAACLGAIALSVTGLRARWLAGAGIAGAAFLALPFHAFSGGFVDARLLPFALPLALAGFRFAPRRARALGVAASLATAGYVGAMYVHLDTRVGAQVHAAEAALPVGVRIRSVATTSHPARSSPFVHAHAWLVVRRDAVTLIHARREQNVVRPRIEWRVQRRGGPAEWAAFADVAWVGRREPRVEAQLAAAGPPLVEAGPLRIYSLAPWQASGPLPPD